MIWEGSVASDIIVIMASSATLGAVDDCVIFFEYWVCVCFFEDALFIDVY